MNSSNKTKEKNIMVFHEGKEHLIGAPCVFCDRVKKEFDNAVKSGEFYKAIGIPAKDFKKIVNKAAKESNEMQREIMKDKNCKHNLDGWCRLCVIKLLGEQAKELKSTRSFSRELELAKSKI